jgi:hypothetical protein
MQQFMRKFEQLNGVEAKVVIEHYLFDNQRFYCRRLQTINDDDRIGVLLKNREIFMYKQDVKVAEAQDNIYIISDGRLTITINCKKI